MDNSVDLVFTNHAIEPNKKTTEAILKELYRISRKGLILCEPDFSTSNPFQKKRMLKNNYSIDIDQKLKKLKIEFKKIQLINSININNKTTVFIIKKNIKQKISHFSFVDPYFKKKIRKFKKNYYSNFLNCLFFSFEDIPLFNFDNPIILSKLRDKI